jgi:hypothetical protein
MTAERRAESCFVAKAKATQALWGISAGGNTVTSSYTIEATVKPRPGPKMLQPKTASTLILINGHLPPTLS